MSQIDSFVFDGPVASRSDGEQSTTSASTTAASIILPVDQYNACMINCPVTPEYNPVCGTDNIVYTNPELLSCAIRCGKKVTLNYYGRCTSTPTTTTIASVTLPDDQYNACVMNCPITSEYNPVCGTDSIDYINPGLLSCAARCGKEVTLNYHGRCSTSGTG